MTMNTSSTFANFLQTHYGSNVNQEIIKGYNNDEIKFILEQKIRAEGKNFTEPVKVRPASGSTAWHAESGATPTAAKGVEMIVSESVKFISTAKEISQHLLNLTKTGGHTFLKAVDDLNDEAVTEHRQTIDKTLFSNNGYLGICASCAAGNVAITMGTGTNMEQFYVGQKVSVFLMSSGAINSVGVATDVIAAVAKATLLVTLTTGVAAYGSIDSTYGICELGAISGATHYHINSIPDIVSDTTTGPATLHGQTVATYPEWVAYYKSIAGTLDPKDVQQAVDEVETYKGSKLSILLGHANVVREYQFDLIDPKIMIVNEGARDAGPGDVYFKGRSKRRLPVVVAAFCNPTDALFGMDKSSIKTMYTALTQWMSDDTGNMLHKKTGFAAYEATFGSELNILGYKRYLNFCLDNIT